MLKLLIILIIILIIWIGLSKIPFSKVFTVKKGKNYSKPFMLRIFLFFKPKTFSFKVSFDNTWRYSLAGGKNEGDQKDINKVIGIGFFPWHHVYSVRFGARYNPDIDRVELMPYIYKHGERIRINDPETNEEFVLTNCLLNNTDYECVLKVNRKTYEMTVYVDGIKNGKTLSIEKGHNIFIGYSLRPYFGGNQKAPHDFNTKVSYKK